MVIAVAWFVVDCWVGWFWYFPVVGAVIVVVVCALVVLIAVWVLCDLVCIGIVVSGLVLFSWFIGVWGVWRVWSVMILVEIDSGFSLMLWFCNMHIKLRLWVVWVFVGLVGFDLVDLRLCFDLLIVGFVV